MVNQTSDTRPNTQRQRLRRCQRHSKKNNTSEMRKMATILNTWIDSELRTALSHLRLITRSNNPKETNELVELAEESLINVIQELRFVKPIAIDENKKFGKVKNK